MDGCHTYSSCISNHYNWHAKNKNNYIYIYFLQFYGGKEGLSNISQTKINLLDNIWCYLAIKHWVSANIHNNTLFSVLVIIAIC